jgi:hypothetical protein
MELLCKGQFWVYNGECSPELVERYKMPKGIPNATVCPKCGKKTLRDWCGNKLAGHDCHHCGFGEWWVVGKEGARFPSQPKTAGAQVKVK